jgi:hypothetical protein
MSDNSFRRLTFKACLDDSTVAFASVTLAIVRHCVTTEMSLLTRYLQLNDSVDTQVI